MARICKSLKAPDQGYRHRDHRSAKHRKPMTRTERRQRAFMQQRLERKKEKHFNIQQEVEIYCSSMDFIRRNWRFQDKK